MSRNLSIPHGIPERRSSAGEPPGLPSQYLEARGLSKFYGKTKALDGVTLGIQRGSITALLGPNGAGKSTFFGCVLGLIRPTGGEVLLGRRALRPEDRLRFGYLCERVALYPQRTAAENALFFGDIRGQNPTEVEAQLKRVGLDPVSHRKVRQLSRGMLQRLGLAIALCGQPDLLILDEPFNGLDPALLDSLQGILREERERGATMLISTHTMSAIEPLASHVAILLQGRLAAAGSVETLRAEYGWSGSLETLYHQIARQGRALEEVLT